jgi:Zn-dependent protease with chaperone function
MEFFEHQDVARRQTGRLVFLFVAAVLLLIVAAYLVVAGVIVATGSGPFRSVWEPRLLLVVGLATLAVVSGGCLFKLLQLRGGGAAIAEHLGGTLLTGGNCDARGRVLLNVVDEMALASGLRSPVVYLLRQEQGINAFAAGWTPEDAVIGVTQGALERLDRDQLQGVIAHEFSHILNGDMRLNLRLVGLLHGILVLGLIGRTVLRAVRVRRVSGGSRKGGGAVAAVLAIALGLMVVGFAGTLLGSLIQAAVCRQREYLADASAVQFTRNPGGIAGALKIIGGFARGSELSSPQAGEARHMVFARAHAARLASPFATHPPLGERIKRIDPAWDGELVVSVPPASATDLAAPAGASPAERMLSLVGRLTPGSLAVAGEALSALPPALAEALTEPYAARAVVPGLILSRDETVRERQWQLLAQAEAGLIDEVRRLRPAVVDLGTLWRLPLIDLSVSPLRALSPERWAQFLALLDALIASDSRVDLFEWSLRRILRRVTPAEATPGRPEVSIRELETVREECALLLSSLARAGAGNSPAAFAAGAQRLPIEGLALLPAEACEPERLDDALDALAALVPLRKRDLLGACAATVLVDHHVAVEEAELLRAIADALGCPVPPDVLALAERAVAAGSARATAGPSAS